jgi:hypothetical protein
MPLHIEVHDVPHPYKLCMECKDALGTNCITFEPGDPKEKKVFVCDEHLPDIFKDFAEGIIRLKNEGQE